MNPQLAKTLVKGFVGVVIAIPLGYMVKMEHKIDDKIDEHYDKKAKKNNETDDQK